MINKINKESIDATINNSKLTKEIQEQTTIQKSSCRYKPRQIYNIITTHYQRFLNNQERRKVKRMNPQKRGEYFMKLHKKDYHK